MTSFFPIEDYERDGVPLKEKIRVAEKKLKEWGVAEDWIKMICDDADGVERVYRMKEKPNLKDYVLYDYVTSM